jgi:tetratricopeptide (TPR) repeat protein
MFRRYFFPVLACMALIASSSIFVSAQVGQLRGHVVLSQADGTKAPAADAVIDVFRTDLPGKYTTKTNKKGEFVFAGLPYTGTYVIEASREGARPEVLPGVKAGREIDYELVLLPGDGKRLTQEEIRAQGASAPTGEVKLTAEEKAKRAELEKKNAEIAASNEKIKNSMEIVGRTFKAGNEALLAKNYDEAIKQYAEGLSADSDQPALLTNEALAYKARGVDKYNSSITAQDEAAKNAGLEAAKSDFRAAAAATTKAVALLKAAPTPTDASAAAAYNNNKLAALIANAESMRLFVTKTDPTQIDAGLAAYAEYIAAETDPVKKTKAQMDAAQMLLDAGAGDKAYAEFQKILTTTPDNADANLGAGLALFSTGDKAKYQEAANYLQHFVDLAPDTHKFKADAKAILAELKNTEKVVPEKTAPARRGRRP